MNNIIIPLTITFLAGISTTLGIIPIFFNDKYKDYIINFSLSFAAGVMITISIFSLIVESFKYLNSFNIITILLVLIFINIGIIISIFIDKKLSKRINNNDLLKIGIVGIITIILHNIPEGIITFITSTNNLKIGLSLALAISLHNIPEGISIAVPIYYSTRSYKTTFIYTFIAGFSEFLGAIITLLFLKNNLNNFIISLILGITAGVMIQISFYELIPTSLKYNNKVLSLIAFILGITIMLLTITI